MKKLDPIEFKNQVIAVHKNSPLNFDELSYVNSRTKVKVKCTKHLHDFLQTPQTLVKGANNCKFCLNEIFAQTNKKPNEFYLTELKKVFDGVYDSNKTIFYHVTNIHIFCEEHGYFSKDFTSLKRGYGCPKCKSNKKTSGVRKDTASFIKVAKDIHGDKFNYKHVDYTHGNKAVSIYCNTCKSDFLQKPRTHLSGKGCPTCSLVKNRLPKLYNRISVEDLSVKCNLIFNNSLDFTDSELTTANEKVTVFCKKCGTYFKQYKGHLVRGVGCQKCSKAEKESKPEKLISKLLDELNVLYEREVGFEGCVYKNALKFDFYLPIINTCIEYQGEQHYKPVGVFGGETAFKLQQIKDDIKRKYCQENQIRLIEIKYDDDIESKIKEITTECF